MPLFVVRFPGASVTVSSVTACPGRLSTVLLLLYCMSIYYAHVVVVLSPSPTTRIAKQKRRARQKRDNNGCTNTRVGPPSTSAPWNNDGGGYGDSTIK